MRAVRLKVVGVVVVGLVATLATLNTNPAAAGPTASPSAPSAPSAPVAARQAALPWSPPAGVVFSNALSARSRIILSRVIDTINHAPRNSTIRIAVWNFDDRAARLALIRAHYRGVHVKVVVAGSVDNRNYTLLAKALNRRRTDQSYARRCHGGCRSNARIMHSKIYLFDRIGRRRNISMFGSANLTTPAGNRQWNDMVTTYSAPLYDLFVQTFEEYARDRPVWPAFKRTVLANGMRVSLWPTQGRNPVLDELRNVRCRGALGMVGGRTKIRIAIAGWFDDFGTDIARQVRRLWDHGCDIKIVTTLAGRGANRVLKAGYGRGPVPINRIGVDRNEDGVPEKYLHMKAVAIKGVFGDDRRARVILTGSPNWSARAARSEEMLVRIPVRSPMVDAYIVQINRLYGGPAAFARTAVGARSGDPVGDALLRRYTNPDAGALPAWFELD